MWGKHSNYPKMNTMPLKSPVKALFRPSTKGSFIGHRNSSLKHRNSQESQ